jgi:N-acetyl-gamma-glutamyl-phosphate reductase
MSRTASKKSPSSSGSSTDESSLGVAILGGTGYGAAELLRLLSQHPRVDLVSIQSSSQSGKSISSVHPNLEGVIDGRFEDEISFEKLRAYDQAFIFSALPHGVSAEKLIPLCKQLENETNIKLIDLSGEFRLHSEELRKQFYPTYLDKGLGFLSFVHGIPEINPDEIRSARMIANPGCFALTSILALAPFCHNSNSEHIVVDGKSGTSGAGRALNSFFHHPEAHANTRAYKILEHRHEPEIRQALGSETSLSFVPHVVPASRGIFITTHVLLSEKVAEELDQQTIEKWYGDYYADAPFVRLREESPQVANVVGSNFCDIHLVKKGKCLVALSATDNLIKGMAGTAVQNMNLMAGISQETGLLAPGLRVI